MKYPGIFDAAEKISTSSQEAFTWSLKVELGALAAAALASQVPARHFGSMGPAATIVLFLMALAIRVSGAGDHAQRRWYDARAAAESAKSMTWEYAVGGEAYRLDDPGAASRFRADLDEVVHALPNLDVPVGTTGLVTPEMAELRAAGAGPRMTTYLKDRIDEQLDWYTRKALANRRSRRQWRGFLIGTEALAVMVGIARLVFKFDIDWLGVIATVGAGMTAWQQARKYAELAEAYSVTSFEVAAIKDSFRDDFAEDEWGQFVHDSEAAFSREHTLWVARRQGPLA